MVTVFTSVNMNINAHLFSGFNAKCITFPQNVYHCTMSDEAVVKRIKVIVKEHGGQLALANAIGVDQGFISKVINQKQDISYYLIRKLCFQLKYSPEWLILGTGDKMIHKPDSAKLITEIQMLRTEVDILHARMRAYEIQLEELKQHNLTDKQKAG
ncbi:transcriptional regulator with XRE-family HTH domain [Mucilaginibacter sp. UYNi724]